MFQPRGDISSQALELAVLHADETGWRVIGKTHWRRCFSTRDLTYYMIARSRGSPALAKSFIEEFSGTLGSDFWSACNAVVCALRQTCLVHLLRELEQTEKCKSPGESWPEFAKKLWRLVLGLNSRLANALLVSTVFGEWTGFVADGRSGPSTLSPVRNQNRRLFECGVQWWRLEFCSRPLVTNS